ncbi:hypothetical protein DKX38_001758 [Salix brachista]|uniref:Conserved oligomeric Golgi complex subunit 6 n=1 Tax=Salix brachista TaxID=2182728 RepID=A0A5N5P4N1_9ROSI|nr:hypothetical protein DKX38_001758 [Salix brachista]
MGTPVGLAPGLSRKLKKVLECRTDSPDLVASLNTLSIFYNENTPQSRRNLRSTIEDRSLHLNHEFLQASHTAQQALDRVEEEVNALAECCDNIAKALSSCSASTGDIISTTERLKEELEITSQRQDVVSSFLRDYQLSNQEINALRDEDLNDNFFKALSHVQQIHANCKVLLRTHHQRAGLELMDMMANHSFHFNMRNEWVQAECRKLGDNDNPEVDELLKTAIRWLKERPALFKYCAEEVANMRHNALFRRFISALTRGGPGGMPRPIEVHAHDPLRYVGDMLGWLHQALASERELVLALLDPDAVVDTGSTVNRFSKSLENGTGKTESDLTFVLDRIFEGVCRPFKVRVEQVLQSQPSLIIACKLSNTLEFYSYTISDLLGRDTALCYTLWALRDAAQKTFLDILKSRGEKLLRYPPLVSVDLSPPKAVREGVSVLLEIIETHNGMMVPATGKKPDFDPVISALLDPIIQMCEQAAEAHKSKGVGHASRKRMTSDPGQISKSSVDALLSNNSPATSSKNSESPSKIFLINCLCAIQQPLSRHKVAAGYLKKLGEMIENHMHSLVEKEVEAILSRCGLSQKMHYFQKSLNEEGRTAAGTPLVEIEDTSPVSLSECLRAFFGLILGNESSLPEFELMQVPKLRSEAGIQVARSLAEAYTLIYTAIMDPKNGYAEPQSLARHPPDQIRIILGI